MNMNTPSQKVIDKIIKKNFKDREMLTQSPMTALKNLKARMQTRRRMYAESRADSKTGMTKKEFAVWDTAIEVVDIEILKLEGIEREANIVDTLVRLDSPDHPRNKPKTEDVMYIDRYDILKTYDSVGDLDFEFGAMPMSNPSKFYTKSEKKTRYYNEMIDRMFEEMQADSDAKLVHFRIGTSSTSGIAVIDKNGKVIRMEVLTGELDK